MRNIMWSTDLRGGRPRPTSTLEIAKQFPQWYVPVSRLPPESINYNSAQEEPEKQEPYANQANECPEPKEEFYDCKNIIKESQNQALCSFPNPCGNMEFGVRAPQYLQPYVPDSPRHLRFLRTHHTSHRLRHDSAPAVLPIPGRVRPRPSLDR